MFDNFPYTNFHEMNLDWMIKIAKDFLDQYTNIQETITQGLEDLDTKAQNLEQLLQAWYDQHSQDIADQLANALQEIDTALDSELNTSIQEFNQLAGNKTAELLASIPADYSNLTREVEMLKNNAQIKTINLFDKKYNLGVPNEAVGQRRGSSVAPSTTYGYTDLYPIQDVTDTLYAVENFTNPVTTIYIRYYDNDDCLISEINGLNIIDSAIPQNAVSFGVTFHVSNLDNVMITLDDVPQCTIPYGVIPNFIRYDQGIINNYFPNQHNVGDPAYPLYYYSGVCCTFPVPVPDDRILYFYNVTGSTFNHLYYDNDGKYISNEDSAYDSKVLTIPANCKFIISYSVQLNPDPEKYGYYNSSNPALLAGFGEEKRLGTTLENKKLLFIGDSITEGYYYGGGIPSIVDTIYNSVSVNEGHSGYTLMEDPNYPGESLVQVLEGLSGNYDIVVLSGGYNDVPRAYPKGTLPECTYYTPPANDTFSGALFNYMRIAREKFPNAKILYMLTPYKNWTNLNTTRRQREYWNVIRECANKFSVDVIDLAMDGGLVGTEVSGYNDPITQKYYRNADGTHPNYYGYKYLEPFIANEIMKHI